MQKGTWKGLPTLLSHGLKLQLWWSPLLAGGCASLPATWSFQGVSRAIRQCSEFVGSMVVEIRQGLYSAAARNWLSGRLEEYTPPCCVEKSGSSACTRYALVESLKKQVKDLQNKLAGYAMLHWGMRGRWTRIWVLSKILLHGPVATTSKNYQNGEWGVLVDYKLKAACKGALLAERGTWSSCFTQHLPGHTWSTVCSSGPHNRICLCKECILPICNKRSFVLPSLVLKDSCLLEQKFSLITISIQFCKAFPFWAF